MASHVSYGQSMVIKCRVKADIQREFRIQNQHEKNAEVAKYNKNCYRKHKQQQEQKRNACLNIFRRNWAPTPQNPCYSRSKHLQELERCDTNQPAHSHSGDSTDYNTEGDEQTKKVLAQMPLLPPVPALSKAPPAASRAGQQLLPPLPPPPPPAGGSGTSLLRQALCMPLASDVDEPLHPELTILPTVQALLNQFD